MSQEYRTFKLPAEVEEQFVIGDRRDKNAGRFYCLMTIATLLLLTVGVILLLS